MSTPKTPFVLAPFQSNRPFILTRDISKMIHLNETGVFSTSTLAYGSMRDNHAANKFLGTRSINSTSPGQTPVTAHSGIYPSSGPSNYCGSIDPFSDHGDRLAFSDFDSRSARQGRQTIVTPVASSRILAPPGRAAKRHWCEACDTGFPQRQGLLRHHKDVHGSRQLCPHCGDFDWSPVTRAQVHT